MAPLKATGSALWRAAPRVGGEDGGWQDVDIWIKGHSTSFPISLSFLDGPRGKAASRKG